MRGKLAVLGFAALLAGCASDALSEPEPTLETPGAFVAWDDGEGALGLERTLEVLPMALDTIVFVTEYDVAPRSYEEAQELSKNHDLPMRIPVAMRYMSLSQDPHRVVWFRTLTDAERARVD